MTRPQQIGATVLVAAQIALIGVALWLEARPRSTRILVRAAPGLLLLAVIGSAGLAASMIGGAP